MLDSFAALGVSSKCLQMARLIMPKTIFVVDDSLLNLSMAEEALEKYYRVITLSSAKNMYAALDNIVPDLILLDVAMPEESGFEAMTHLKSDKNFADIPVIFLTALTDSFNEALGIELGAVDFIAKPFSEPVLLNRVKNHLHLDEILCERTKEIVQQRDTIVFAMADTIECRNVHAEGHVARTTAYLKILLEGMIEQGIYVGELHQWRADIFLAASQLHDVGSISIPSAILNKPESLTKEELGMIKTHTIEGEKIIDKMISLVGDAGFLQCAKLFVVSHHERWDGTGYPNGLKGVEIPLHGRMMAVVDVYDALTTDRPYRKTFTHEAAVDMIKNDANKHFDPKITNVFCKISDQFKTVK